MPAFALSGLGVAGPHVGINSNDSDNNSNDNSVFVHASPPSTLLGGTSGLTAGPLPTIPDFPFASGADTHSRCRPPYCDWTSWAGGFSVGAKAVFGETVRISSMFSGIGTESCATAILGRHYGTAPGLNPTFHHTCAFETRKAARDVLVAGSHGAVFGDIFGLLPLALRSWIDNGSHTFGSLQARIIEARPVVSRKAFCYRAETEVEVLLGDIVVCGIPCVDFSPMGMQRGLGGPTGALVCAWVRIILEYLPAVILIEEVPGFVKHGLSYLGSKGALGEHYSFDHALLDPRCLGLPVSRPRMYCIGCLRSRCELAQPLHTLLQSMPGIKGTTGSSLDFFYMSGAPDKLTPAQNRRLNDYVKLFGATANVYDLSQNPLQRPRRLLQCGALPAITKSCRLYSTQHRRFMLGSEALTAQGWPMQSGLAHHRIAPLQSLEGLSVGVATSFAGNGMHVGCLGLSLDWIFRMCDRAAIMLFFFLQ